MSKRVEERVDVDWDSGMPLSLLPEDIQEAFKMQANFLYCDLEGKINIVLTREPNRDGECSRFEGHRLRYVDERNPEWYSELHERYDKLRERISKSKSKRKRGKMRPGRTIGVIKRRESLFALERIKDGNDKQYREVSGGFIPYFNRYDMIYRELIYQHLTDGFKSDGVEAGPARKVVDYFSGNGKK